MNRSKYLVALEDLSEIIGAEDLITNIAAWMSTDDLADCVTYIDRMFEANLFYTGTYVSEVQDWMGKTLYSFEFEEYGEDCEAYAILKREEIASEEAQQEWQDNKEQCIKDGYNSVEELEDAMLEDLYIVSYNKQWEKIPVNFG